MPKRYRIKDCLALAKEDDCYGMGSNIFAELIGKEFGESDITERVKEDHHLSAHPDLLGEEDWQVAFRGRGEWWVPSGWIEEIT